MEIIQRLSESIATALPPSLATAPPRRLWLACGSGVILRALGSVWPKAKFGVVQVGKTIYDDICEGLDFTLHVAPERFAEPASEPPPFPSVTNYDAKVWQFVDALAENGDVVWNVGKDVEDTD
mmetsp:Transcript_12603/g.27015  ORF Transcript_12603/g.27015 Transcript_12603/m.27015 type:complete len:123 (+) Transcript_12603:365-733(+)